MPETKYWVLSETATHPSQPQQYLSESRLLTGAVSARDWRDFVEGQYREKKDDREVLLVKIMDDSQIKQAIEEERKHGSQQG